MGIEEWINRIHCGDAYKLLRQMPSESVDCVVTSPPYYGLRVYGETSTRIFNGDPNCQHEWGDAIPVKDNLWRWDTLKNETHPNGVKQAKWTIAKDLGSFCIKCGAWRGQLGLEPTYQMYVEHLVELFREVKRVLKKTGSFWLNIGDTYSSTLGRHGNRTAGFSEKTMVKDDVKPPRPKDIPPKCLMGIPWRVALAMIDDGWILRNAIIWHKPNAMPSSVKDRLAQTYEYIFHFVKSRKYYYCLDNIREPHRTIPTPNPLKNDVEKFSFNKLIEYCLKKYEEAMKERIAYDHKGGDEAPESFKSASEWNRGSRETMNKIIDSLNVPEEVKVKLRSWWHDVQSHPKGKNIGDTWKWSEETREMGWYHNLGRIRQLMRMLGLPEQNPLGRNPGDILNFDPWLEILRRRAKAGGSEREAYEFYRKWKEENPQGTYEEFYEIMSSKKLSKHQKMKWQTGIDAKWSAWGNYASYLNLPNPKGKNPGDYFSIPTKPFKGAHFACVDEETECLTDRGWVNYRLLQKGDRILAYDMKSGQLVFTTVEDVYVYDYDGPMIQVKSSQIDMLLTPNHRVVCKRRVRKADKGFIKAKYSKPMIIEAQELNEDYLIPQAAPYRNRRMKAHFPPEFASLLGWIITEGYFDERNGEIRIYQSKRANPEYCMEIEELLKKLNIPYRKVEGHDECMEYILPNDVFNLVRKIIPHKDLEWNLILLPTPHLKALFEALMKGDGSIREDGRMIFTQKSKHTVDVFQALAILLGYRAIVSQKREGGVYEVYLTRKKWHGLRRTRGSGSLIQIVNYKGKVWCPKTKYGTFIARRNGRPFITGNTFPPELPLRPILASCPPDGIVLDPLAGSGTVAVTCELINRGMWDEFRIPVNNIARSVKWNIKWILIEINPEYCKLMEERLEPFIKQKRLDEFKRT
jgi:DNA modification methylase